MLEELDKKRKELEEEENRLYTEGKKKMTVLRKQKETELLHELQHTQEKMANLLAQQMVQKSNDENEKIAKAVAEEDAKKAVSFECEALSLEEFKGWSLEC